MVSIDAKYISLNEKLTTCRVLKYCQILKFGSKNLTQTLEHIRMLLLLIILKYTIPKLKNTSEHTIKFWSFSIMFLTKCHFANITVQNDIITVKNNNLRNIDESKTITILGARNNELNLER